MVNTFVDNFDTQHILERYLRGMQFIGLSQKILLGLSKHFKNMVRIFDTFKDNFEIKHLLVRYVKCVDGLVIYRWKNCRHV